MDAKKVMADATKYAADNIERLSYELLYRSAKNRLPGDSKLSVLRTMLQKGGMPHSHALSESLVKNVALRHIYNSGDKVLGHVFEPREDELAHCIICGGAEASLPQDCPGQAMSDEQAQGVQAGTLNYIDGEWRTGKMVNWRFVADEKPTKQKVEVWFQHDMDDSWYYAKFPDPELDGNYNHSTSIKKLADDNSWEIVWCSEEHYNPWRQK